MRVRRRTFIAPHLPAGNRASYLHTSISPQAILTLKVAESKTPLFLKNNLTERGTVSSKYPNNIHGELLMPYH